MLVLVPVTLTDDHDRVVLGLKETDSRIFDRADKQEIRHFSTKDAPISLGIILDASSSMYRKRD